MVVERTLVAEGETDYVGVATSTGSPVARAVGFASAAAPTTSTPCASPW